MPSSYTHVPLVWGSGCSISSLVRGRLDRIRKGALRSVEATSLKLAFLTQESENLSTRSSTSSSNKDDQKPVRWFQPI